MLGVGAPDSMVGRIVDQTGKNDPTLITNHAIARAIGHFLEKVVFAIMTPFMKKDEVAVRRDACCHLVVCIQANVIQKASKSEPMYMFSLQI